MAKYLDESILDELDREGFFKRLLGKSWTRTITMNSRCLPPVRATHRGSV